MAEGRVRVVGQKAVPLARRMGEGSGVRAWPSSARWRRRARWPVPPQLPHREAPVARGLPSEGGLVSPKPPGEGGCSTCRQRRWARTGWGLSAAPYCSAPRPTEVAASSRSCWPSTNSPTRRRRNGLRRQTRHRRDEETASEGLRLPHPPFIKVDKLRGSRIEALFNCSRSQLSQPSTASPLRYAI